MYRKKRKNATTTAAVMPMVHRSRTPSTSPPTSTVWMFQGFVSGRLSKPQIAVISGSMTNRSPIVIMMTANGGWPTMRRSTSRSTLAPTTAAAAHARRIETANAMARLSANV